MLWNRAVFLTETCLCKRVAPVPHVYFHAVRFLSPWALRPCSLRQPCCSYSIPPGCKQAFHHVVRPPGGVVAKQSSALCFWLVDISHKCLDRCLFAHRTASFKRLMNSSLPSDLVGIVWPASAFFPAGQFAQTGFAMIGFCFSRHVWKNALKQNVMEQGCVFVPHAGRKSVDQADASSEHLALEAFIALPSRK